MKTNTTIGIILLCVICTATLMAGCLTDDAINNDVPDRPVMYVDMAQVFNSDGEDMIRITLSSDGTADACGVDGHDTGDVPPSHCEPGTWERCGPNEYDIFVEHFADIHATILPNGKVEFEIEGLEGHVYKGIWKPRSDDIKDPDTVITQSTATVIVTDNDKDPEVISTKAKSVAIPRSTPKPTPTPAANVESGFVMGYPFLVSITGTGVQEGINFIVMIDDDGETCYHYTWCGMNIGAAQEIIMMDVTHNGDSITYRGNDPDGMALSITAYETERGGGRATQIGFDEESDCVWNPWDNIPKTITGKIVQYNQEWL
jgi:hypothetical protein